MVEKQPNRQQANGSLDFEGLMKTLKYLLDAAWGPDWGRFSPDGPNVTDPRNVEYPIVTYGLQELRPGKIGKSGTREIKPRYRYMDRTRDVNGTQPPAVTIYGQVMEGEITFEIWEETNAQADEMAKQLRALIATYAGYLKEKGLKEIIFLKQQTGALSSHIQDSHKVRVLTYFVKFEELNEVPTDIFRVMEVVDKRLQEESM